ncbi:MAG TPA: FtsQ-type POTRA domain-containing protein [Geobacteraceae bacterium]|nr:FtsQ-type POTRA domain-containing protein [Geobacteraceae bacterium]
MYDLHTKKNGTTSKNRLKKQRKPINYRSLFKKAARLAGGLTVVSLAVIAGYELYGVVIRTTFLRLDRIEISSLRRLHREDVVALAGVKPGDDMLKMRPQRIGEQLMKNPWVENVKVRRYFPHTLAIEIAEREPVAVVSMGYLYYLDGKGNVFKPLTEGDRLDYPVLTGFSEEDMWKDPSGSREALKEALDLIRLLSGGQVMTLTEISELHYDKGYGFTLFTMRGGVPVKLGNSGFSEKLARLSRIYRDLQAQMPALEYIDLDYNDKIIVKKV